MITRQNPEGDYPGEIPGESITLEEAMKIFTINGAISMEHDDVTGSIEVGKYADMIVLNRNPFDIDPAEVSETIVMSTVFEGEEVYSGGQKSGSAP